MSNERRVRPSVSVTAATYARVRQAAKARRLTIPQFMELCMSEELRGGFERDTTQRGPIAVISVSETTRDAVDAYAKRLGVSMRVAADIAITAALKAEEAK